MFRLSAFSLASEPIEIKEIKFSREYVMVFP